MPRGSGASVRAPGRSMTSECVSSISKIRSAAAIACWRLVFTRLSFLSGVYIMNAAKMNADEIPLRHRPLRDLLAAVPQRHGERDAAEELHQRRQHRQGAGHLDVGAIEALRRAPRTRRSS